MTIASILKLPIEIIQRIIDLIDDRNTLLALTAITQFKDSIYKRLFPKLNIFYKQPNKSANYFYGNKLISFYFLSKFFNFLDDYDNYIPIEISTNIDTLYELINLKNLNFTNTKFNLFIHPYHTIKDLEFSFTNFEINSVVLRPYFDYQLTGTLYENNEVYFGQLKNEEFQNITFPDTLEKVDVEYDNIFLRNLPRSLRELNLREIDDLNSIKLPLSLRSLSLTNCKINGEVLDLSYLYQLKNFESNDIARIDSDYLSGELKLSSSIESICLSSCDLQSLNRPSDYKNLKVFKLMRCGGSIFLFNTKLPPRLEYLEMDSPGLNSVVMEQSRSMNSDNVTLIDRPQNGKLFNIGGENIFPLTLKSLKLTEMSKIVLDTQLDLPYLEILEISGAALPNPHRIINENLINLRKLTVNFCDSPMESVKFPKNLEYLNLRNNRIYSLIPFNLIQSNKLKHLDVCENRITSITGQLAPNLKILDISYNPIIKLHKQENLEQLILSTSTKTGDICINNLESFELEIEDFDYFSKFLGLEVGCEQYEACKIYDYKFDSCYYLKKLILRLEVEKCNIEHFNFNNLPKNLENFSIIYSDLNSIYGSLENLKNLKLLNLKSNRINNSGLENCLFSSPNLEAIDLNGNYIKNTDCIKIRDCPRLIELNLKMVSSIRLYITDGFEEKLKLTCPRLSIVRGFRKV
ncbi:uncharacterized protein KGF55_000078 [Candida pseudojiufengensis]|uniref:uncharacterized protein n=1 Tax=Candida pseudojiufengensis TaxID=497109 RepID=UPI0022247D14|nr:uncharacterized protein KGF55_000078 [Candida pseudojiufengensis]KAI5967807.1 hypothetical protein KGF55_000078 [Candida pseudojiufengensis]